MYQHNHMKGVALAAFNQSHLWLSVLASNIKLDYGKKHIEVKHIIQTESSTAGADKSRGS